MIHRSHLPNFKVNTFTKVYKKIFDSNIAFRTTGNICLQNLNISMANISSFYVVLKTLIYLLINFSYIYQVYIHLSYITLPCSQNPFMEIFYSITQMSTVKHIVNSIQADVWYSDLEGRDLNIPPSYLTPKLLMPFL